GCGGSMGMTTRRKPLVQPKVRLRDDLHKRLSQAAKKAGRSLNQEIASRLEESFEQQAALAMYDALVHASDERGKQLQHASANLEELTEKVTRLTELLEAGAKK